MSPLTKSIKTTFILKLGWTFLLCGVKASWGQCIGFKTAKVSLQAVPCKNKEINSHGLSEEKIWGNRMFPCVLSVLENKWKRNAISSAPWLTSSLGRRPQWCTVWPMDPSLMFWNPCHNRQQGPPLSSDMLNQYQRAWKVNTRAFHLMKSCCLLCYWLHQVLCTSLQKYNSK